MSRSRFWVRGSQLAKSGKKEGYTKKRTGGQKKKGGERGRDEKLRRFAEASTFRGKEP